MPRPDVTLVGMGALMPEMLAAADRLEAIGIAADVVCVTSADRLNRSVRARSGAGVDGDAAILAQVFPAERATPMVTVLDGHPHSLAFLAVVRGVRSINLGVTEFGQPGTLQELYRLHGIGADAQVAAALDLVDRTPAHRTALVLLVRPTPRRREMPENQARNWPVNAPKLHHAAFTTLRMHEMVTWYGLVCGLRPVFQSDGASWLTNDEANHRIALLSPPGLKHPTDKGHETGLHHTAYEFLTFDMWLNNYIRLRDHGILPFLTLDHGVTMSIYYQDPDGNGVEIQVDGFGDWASSSEWMANAKEFAENPIGTYFDPEKLVAARDEGLSFQEIHERARAGEYLPAVIPEDIFLPEVW